MLVEKCEVTSIYCDLSLLTMSLKDKVALVTGAAQGLGRGFAEILLKNGAKVAFLDLNETLGKDLQDQFNEIYGSDRTQFYPGDVASHQQFKDVFQKVLHKFGRIDIVCNNAGILNEKDWEKTVSINLSGVVRGTYLALDHMKKQRGGQGGVIVNVASLAGLILLPGGPVYTATKHGVVGFSRALAVTSEVVDAGVRINTLCPEFVRTSLLDSFKSEEKAGPFTSLQAVAQSLLDKFSIIEVEEVAKAFLLLVQDESLNGAVLTVGRDGAALMSFPTELQRTPVAL
ncbi:15-hydroxyprostaglandin dehydrogenase [NAD(+)]-like [Brachyhypopomus gauderio]|uniref:15-hydroxyprostaglandin dehydrogenase [NAD(+)]-like n=1 Tax=Brachyhypopomus gauderio TaxID=698409 RepID=UPI004043532F